MARTPKADVNPDVLVWARSLAGWGVPELAKRVGTTPERVEGWEAGSGRPTLGQLRQLADVYRRPVATFFLSEPPRGALPSLPDFRGQDEQFELSRGLRSELRRAAMRRQVMADLTGERLFALRDFEFHDDDLRGTAQSLRTALGIPLQEQLDAPDASGALSLWISALNASGVLVFQMSRVDARECRGFSIYADSLPVVVANGSDPPQARVFTLAHETAHLARRSGGLCTLFSDTAAERQCNEVAAELLMPRGPFLDALGSLDPFDSVGVLARRFRVSQEAAAVRLRVLDRLSRDQLDVVRARTRERVEENRHRQRETTGGPPHHRTQLRNLGRDYVSTVLEAREDRRITPAEASHYLESKLTTVDRMETELTKLGAAG